MNGRGSLKDDYFSGRVEVRRDGGPWGTVCDDEFDQEEAFVICGGFGFDFGLAKRQAYFGEGVGHIFMDDLRCTRGQNGSVFECPYNGWGRNNCGHNQDAGVICEVSAFLGSCLKGVKVL